MKNNVHYFPDYLIIRSLIYLQEERLSAPEIAERVGKSLRTTKRYLNALKKSNKIEFRGAPKTGGYYLK